MQWLLLLPAALVAEGWPLLVLCLAPLALLALAGFAVVFVGPLHLLGLIDIDD